MVSAGQPEQWRGSGCSRGTPAADDAKVTHTTDGAKATQYDRLAATYRVMLGRSTSVTGPYVDKNGHPMTTGGGTEILAGHAGIHLTGHQAVLTDTDGDILFYHYYADNKDGGSGCHYCKFGINHIGYDRQAWPFVY